LIKKIITVFLLIAVAFPTTVSIYNFIKATTSNKTFITNLVEEETEKSNSEKEEKGKDKYWGPAFNIPPVLFLSRENYFVAQTNSDLLQPVQDLPTPPPKTA
jgi:hypothetical protein